MPSTPEPFWDADTVARYHAGTLPEAEAAALERAAAEDAFLATALEGGSQLSPEVVGVLTSKIQRRALSKQRWVWSLSAMTVLAVLVVLFWPEQPSPEPGLTELSQPTPVETPEISPEETSTTSPQVVQRSRTDSSVNVTVRVSASVESTPTPEEPEEFFQTERLEEAEMRKLQPTLFESHSPQPELAQNSEHAVYEIAQYRVVDYSGEREQQVANIPQPDPRSLSPEFSDRVDLDDPLNQSYRPAPIGYEEALELAVGHYAAGRFRIALWHFEDILKVYPTDANAQFYGGMCALKLHEYPSAREHLVAAAYNPVRTFSEPAAFYAAEALYAFGNPNQARMEFIKIAESGGFYAGRAKRELGED